MSHTPPPESLPPDEITAAQASSAVPPSLPPNTLPSGDVVLGESSPAIAESLNLNTAAPVADDASLQIEAGSEQISDKPIDGHLNAVAHYPKSPPPSKLRKKRRRDPSPRFLIIAFCMWLLGAWFIALQSTSMIQPIRWMVLCAFFCVMAFWPVLRLSQYREPGDLDHSSSADSYRSAGRLFVDWICLNLVFQTIIWPLHMNAQWHVMQTWWISATLASWSLITGAIIAIGCRSDRAMHRTLATLLCMLLLVGEPVLMVLLRKLPGFSGEGLERGQIVFHTSPLGLVWTLTSPAATWAYQPWVTQVPAVALAGVTAWLVVVATRRWAGQSSEPLPPVRTIDASQR